MFLIDSKTDPKEFWQITGNDKSYTITFGELGTKGSSETKTFDNEEARRRESILLIKTKLGEKYVESSPEEWVITEEERLKFYNKWENLTQSKDLCKSLSEHFAYLTDSPNYNNLLDQIMKMAKKVTIFGKRLVVEFSDNNVLTAYEPGLVEEYSQWPKSFQKMISRHCLLSFPDEKFGCYLGEINSFDPEILATSQLAEEVDDLQKVLVPLTDYSDWWVYHPAIKNSTGEPGICYFSHEDCNTKAPIDINIGSLFLKKMAEMLEIKIEIKTKEISQKKELEGKLISNIKFNKDALTYIKGNPTNWQMEWTFNFPNKKYMGAVYSHYHAIRLYKVDESCEEVSYLYDEKVNLDAFQKKQMQFINNDLVLIGGKYGATAHVVSIDKKNVPNLVKSIRFMEGETQNWCAKENIFYATCGSSKGSKCFLLNIDDPEKKIYFATEEETGNRYGEIDISLAIIKDKLFFLTTKNIYTYDISNVMSPKLLNKKKMPLSNEARSMCFPKLNTIAIFSKRSCGLILLDIETMKERKYFKGYSYVQAWDSFKNELWFILQEKKETKEPLFLVKMDLQTGRICYSKMSEENRPQKITGIFVNKKYVFIFEESGKYIRASHF